MSEFKPNLDGFRPEPPNPKHWSYEDKLEPKMKALGTGDVDLREFSGPRHNQWRTGSCVANAVVKALEIKRNMKLGVDNHIDLSRMAVYYLARELMHPSETHMDDGTFISLGFDVLRRFGACQETEWPFDTSKVSDPPSWRAMRKAFVNKIDSFYLIRSTGQVRVNEVIKCLRAGNPVVFGTAVNGWNEYRDGEVLYPPNDVQGRHAIVIVGYVEGNFIIENSWGTWWGADGYALMDPSYIADSRSRDFWVVQAGFEEYME